MDKNNFTSSKSNNKKSLAIKTFLTTCALGVSLGALSMLDDSTMVLGGVSIALSGATLVSSAATFLKTKASDTKNNTNFDSNQQNGQ